MKIRDLVSLDAVSINPMNKANLQWLLYSFPSFDDGKLREVVLGTDIRSNKYIVPDKCILFNKLNVRFKRIWRIDNKCENKICSTEFLPLVVNELIADYDYVYYLLNSDLLTTYLTSQNNNTSGSHKRIDPNNFLNIEINIPCLEVQHNIGGVLAAIDKKIELNITLNQNLEAMAKQLYDYWFVQFDFPDLEGKPYKSSGGKMIFNSRLQQNIPDGWSVANLIDVAEIKNGATPSTTDDSNYGGDVVWITPKDLSDQQSKFIYRGSRNITDKGFASCSTNMLPLESVILSSRAPIGLISIAKTALCTNQGFKNIVPNDISESLYFYYYVKHHITQIEQLGSGTTFKEVSRESLSTFPILVASNCKKFNEWIEIETSISEKQFIITKEIESLTKLRDELLPLLMNGQVTVNSDLSHC